MAGIVTRVYYLVRSGAGATAYTGVGNGDYNTLGAISNAIWADAAVKNSINVAITIYVVKDVGAIVR